MAVRRRPKGSGSVEHLGPGRFRARLPRGLGSKRDLGVFETAEEAHAILDGALAHIADAYGETAQITTLAHHARKYLDQRERDGMRDIQNERYRFAEHILNDQIAKMPIDAITRADVKAWAERLRAKKGRRSWNEGKRNARRKVSVSTGKPLSRETVKHVYGDLSRCLKDAVDAGLRADNPALDLPLPRQVRTEEPWTYLSKAEQEAIRSANAIPEGDRLRILFAIGTGLRQAEQWGLLLEDVHPDVEHPHVQLRRTKSGKPRKVALFGIALDAVKRWLELLPTYAPKNPKRLAWPTPRGAQRQRSKTYGFDDHLKVAGITRSVRWHDLRHTFGTSLVNGFWGERWPLPEVRALMGHSTIRMTERYAHVDDPTLNELARRTGVAPAASVPTSSHHRPTLRTVSARRGVGQKRKEPAVTGSSLSSGADGTRTRGLRRDRPAL